MRGQLPPPDPFEPAGTPPGFAVEAPTTLFLRGRPSGELDRVATAILAARPGLLVVCLGG
jgi:hypothetical protein